MATGGKRRVKVWMAALLAAVLLCAGGLYGYARWEYGAIRTVWLDLGAADSRLAGLRIAFGADFQYDMYANNPQSVREKDFERAVDALLALEADIILLGGDYVTFPSNWEAAVPHLARLEAKLGVYAVFGNHDGGAEDKLRQALPGICFLKNETATITYNGAVIEIDGVEDLWRGNPRLPRGSAADCRLLLTHNPDFYEELTETQRARYTLTLAGHTHAGQVTLFGLGAVPGAFKVSAYGERYRYGEKDYGGRIYITSGLGGAVFRMPIRFGARPEVVLIGDF